MFIKRFGLVQHHAEQDTDTGAENCQHGDADGVADSEGGNRINEKKFLRNSERNGNPMRNKGRDYAWNQCSVIHDADTYNFHGENSSSHRCAKQCGETGTHAAHDHNMLVLVVKMKQFTNSVTDASAKLQSSTLTACRSAKQMGDQCGNKDQRSHAKGQLVIRVDGRDDQIGPGIFFVPQKMVGTDNDQSPDREQI